MAIAAWRGKLTVSMMCEAFEGTMRTTAMIMLIVLAALFLNFVLGFIGVTKALTNFISGLGLSPFTTMLVIIVFYLLLGMVMETFAMMLTTIPLVFPIVTSLGYDAVWFGILITVLMETGLITPRSASISMSCMAFDPKADVSMMSVSDRCRLYARCW